MSAMVFMQSKSLMTSFTKSWLALWVCHTIEYSNNVLDYDATHASLSSTIEKFAKWTFFRILLVLRRSYDHHLVHGIIPYSPPLLSSLDQNKQGNKNNIHTACSSADKTKQIKYSYTREQTGKHCFFFFWEQALQKTKKTMTDIDSEAVAAKRIYAICLRRESCSSDKFKALVQRFPNAVCVRNEDDYLPLHWACSTGLNEYIPSLIESWPESVQIPNVLLPLHKTCYGKASLTVIQLLVEAWPDTIHMQNNQGCLPLHCVRLIMNVLMKLFNFCWIVGLNQCNARQKMATCPSIMPVWRDDHWMQSSYCWKLGLTLSVRKIIKPGPYLCIMLARVDVKMMSSNF